MQGLHALNIERLEAVSPRRNEVEAAVHPVVGDVAPIQAALVLQESLELVINIIDNGLVANESCLFTE